MALTNYYVFTLDIMGLEPFTKNVYNIKSITIKLSLYKGTTMLCFAPRKRMYSFLSYITIQWIKRKNYLISLKTTYLLQFPYFSLTQNKYYFFFSSGL